MQGTAKLVKDTNTNIAATPLLLHLLEIVIFGTSPQEILFDH
jgi:hypothetical protein